MTDLENVSQTCFSCGGSKIKEEEHDGATRYTCLQCGEEWSLDANQSAPPGSKKHRPTERWAKTPKKAVIVALVAALSTLVCPVVFFIRDSREICDGYKVDTLLFLAKLTPIALIAAGLGALLARRVHKILAIVLGSFLLVVLALLNLFAMIYPGC